MHQKDSHLVATIQVLATVIEKKIKIMVLLLFALFPWPLLKEFVYVLQITSIEELERAEIFAFFFGDYA